MPFRFLRDIISEGAEMGVVGLTTELCYTSFRLGLRMLSDWGRDTPEKDSVEVELCFF